MGGDTLRHPGQRVMALGVSPDNSGHGAASTRTTLEHFIFVLILYGNGIKNIFGSTWTTGGKKMRFSGQRVVKLHSAPDNGW